MVDYHVQTQTQRHYRDGDTYRHWCRESEPIAPAEVLLQYLRWGWELDNLVGVEVYYHAGCRRSDVYCFTLGRDDDTIEIPVLANPAVFRVVDSHQMTLMRINVEQEDVFEVETN
jgi:hypothetical protein